MYEVGVGVVALLGIVLFFVARKSSARRQSIAQLMPVEVEVEEEVEDPTRAEALESRNNLLTAVAIAVVVACGVWLVFRLPWLWVGSFALVAGILSMILLENLRTRRMTKIESQLADSIDLTVAALRAGAGLLDALDVARRETSAPLRVQLEDVLARIRYGDDPQQVLQDLAERVPLESFRLYAMANAVHWEVGGSVAGTLAAVGRFIRDRVDVRRNIQSQAAQARFSMVAVMGIAYFVGLASWRTDPAQMEAFVTSELGGLLLAAAIVLQAVGVLWISRVSRIGY